MKRIRIIGSCGSGKTTLARLISEETDIPYYQLDNIVWDRSEEVQKRFPETIRDGKLNQIINSSSWVIEGVHIKWTQESFNNADLIIILIPNVFLRDYRIINRFIKTRIGLEESNYKQTFRNLFRMIYAWNHNYDMDGVLKITEPYAHKRIFIKNSKDALKYIKQMMLERHEFEKVT
jgi:adenylate kinase family enzyme